MSTKPILFEKVIAALPAILTPNTVYAVRAGVGFDLYVSDTTGSIAHRINGSNIVNYQSVTLLEAQTDWAAAV